MQTIDDGSETARLGLRERGKQQRATRIVKAARDLLRDNPIEVVTVERIAALAEVSGPTVFNLIGRRERLWSAIVNEALGECDLGGPSDTETGAEAAQRIVGSIADMVCGDAPVFKALVAHWAEAARPMSNNPAVGLRLCFEKSRVADSALHADMVTAGVIGLIHQWAAGMINDDDLRQRGDYLVAMAFGYASQ